VAAPGALAGGLVLASHSRSQELQADRIAMELVARAGWDPAALSVILVNLEREDTLRRRTPRRTRFFDSHPSTADRLQQVAREAASVERVAPRRIAAERASLLARLDGLLLGENPAYGVFAGSRFLHPELDFSVDFPEAWEAQNQPTSVVAVAPESGGETFVLLQLVAESDNPLDGARADALDERLLEGLAPRHVNGLPAIRLVTEQGGTAFDLTWIAHGGVVYRIAGVTPSAGATSQRARLLRVAESFRPLAAEDRASIRESRLRSGSVAPGEGLAEFLARTGSDWSPETAAIANGLEGLAARLRPGELLKLSLPQRHAPPPS